MTNKRISAEQIELINAAYGTGESYSSVARRVGCTWQTVGHRHKLLAEGRPARMPKPPRPNTILQRLEYRNRVLSLAAGNTSKRIAEKIGDGATVQSVEGIIRRYGKAAGIAPRYKNVKAKPVGPRKPANRLVFAPPVIVARAIPACGPAELHVESSEARVAAILSLKTYSCRWPVDQDGTFAFCGDASAVKIVHGEHRFLPYCLCHCALAYRRDERMSAA